MIQPAHGTSRQLQLAHAHPRVEAPDLPSRAHARVWARVPPRAPPPPAPALLQGMRTLGGSCATSCLCARSSLANYCCLRFFASRAAAGHQPRGSPESCSGARGAVSLASGQAALRACAGEGSHLAERARLRLPHERRARIAADHASGGFGTCQTLGVRQRPYQAAGGRAAQRTGFTRERVVAGRPSTPLFSTSESNIVVCRGLGVSAEPLLFCRNS